jgi:succinate dehydrogenase/fumarate reductase-like Fe-S protein
MELGVAMLSSVLNSKRAVMVNIQIMRAFVRVRNLVADYTDFRKAIQNIERRLGTHDQRIHAVKSCSARAGRDKGIYAG